MADKNWTFGSWDGDPTVWVPGKARVFTNGAWRPADRPPLKGSVNRLKLGCAPATIGIAVVANDVSTSILAAADDDTN